MNKDKNVTKKMNPEEIPTEFLALCPLDGRYAKNRKGAVTVFFGVCLDEKQGQSRSLLAAVLVGKHW